jgi:hypothetical protein
MTEAVGFQEWLLADHQGAFAMGTPTGIRRRKYHGYLMGIAGRAQCAGLVDFELELGGRPLWPHAYGTADATGETIAPPVSPHWVRFREEPYPSWRWELPEGEFILGLQPGPLGGMRLGLEWKPRDPTAPRVSLRLRPFLALRDLHGMGGSEWDFRALEDGVWEARTAQHPALFCKASGKWQWSSAPVWHERFHYSEERARGYDFRERLFSAGTWNCALEARAELHWAWSREHLTELPAAARAPRPARVSDFVLNDPPGIVAGYPWFGEWGRDTFIALPGVVAAALDRGAADAAWEWAFQLLERWGQWIARDGALPNLIDRGGEPQWESADATLWWIHSLAALWQMALLERRRADELQGRFAPSLAAAITAIQAGRHAFLRIDRDGLLEVTAPHATWMDARIFNKGDDRDRAVTPRTGRLPEIDALWVQAHGLHRLWSEQSTPSELESMARLALELREADRPNRVFLHSLPLAPSFVLGDDRSLAEDLARLEARLRTPVGLRTLDPSAPGYRGHCAGDQPTRDEAYHQVTVWPWLGAHFEMAQARRKRGGKRGESPMETDMTGTMETALAQRAPIEGHIPEIFDGDAPHAPRGAPAQAWSLACFEEARYRARMKLDQRLSRVIAQRWTERGERAPRRRGRPAGEGILR